jgi:hypothetical protein
MIRIGTSGNRPGRYDTVNGAAGLLKVLQWHGFTLTTPPPAADCWRC